MGAPHAQLTETATQEPVPAANARLLSSVEPPLVPHAQLTETATQEPVPAANAPPLLLREPPLVKHAQLTETAPQEPWIRQQMHRRSRQGSRHWCRMIS